MTSVTSDSYDLAVVGAGVVGLGHALAAVRRGLKVVVIDRDARANGASIRNFGFVTVTGQQRGECWRRAMRSRDIWAEIAPKAGIEVVHRGLLVAVRRPEAVPVLDAFMATEMGEGCALLTPDEARTRLPALNGDLSGALWSPHDLRVESRDAIPKLAAWLAGQGVAFRRLTAVNGVEPGKVETSAGPIRATRIAVCPGDDFHSLLEGRFEPYRLTRCKLHMLRVTDPGIGTLPGSVMTDLSLGRYLGYAELPEAAALKARLAAEQAEHLANGVHLIVVQSADGSLVVGDSHHYDATPDPFAPEHVDDLILDEYRALFGRTPRVVERWIGTYASADDRLAFIDRPDPAIRLVVVTSGTGASTGFAIAEEAVAELFD
ncbi:TIGR03364 family FAD-dependent oxidoreductase [Ancylobacter sp. 6x-1]|uniref:TIGR03364 family FAD-dependent oxidoreductase n=1 Tax=Ancylobacter crimeensis TaxID=2579147 RepID=A0ABT0D7T9_9HYPH|nr:TIGR03364 family FAD-dependent oxidoreductase [Ancylobacter crimeensis]MCK0196001.1 TIGR03364 family FAD-dependent oxidoreductase [Ancylobacter crimeensis]